MKIHYAYRIDDRAPVIRVIACGLENYGYRTTNYVHHVTCKACRRTVKFKRDLAILQSA